MVDLSWTAPDANYDAITAYKILIRGKDNEFYEDTVDCNGASEATGGTTGVLTTASCSVPLATLRAADRTWKLERGAQVIFTVSAYNTYLWGKTSQINTVVATIQTEPSPPPAPTYVPLSSTLTSITVAWAGIFAASADTGGSVIESYNLQWRAAGTTSWSDAQGQDGAHNTALTTTPASAPSLATGLTAGESYLFQVRAYNRHGWSLPSSPLLSVIASGVPSKPDPPTTVLDNLTVKISWAIPAINHSPIDAYRLSIKNLGSNLVVESSYCDGSTEPVKGQRWCQVPMTRFQDVYGLARGARVQASVEAHSINGWGAASDLTAAGAFVETLPGQVGKPFEGTATSES